MVKNQRLRKKAIFVSNFVSFRFVALLPRREQKIQQGACFSFRKDLGLSPSFSANRKKEEKGTYLLQASLFAFCRHFVRVANCFDIA